MIKRWSWATSGATSVAEQRPWRSLRGGAKGRSASSARPEGGTKEVGGVEMVTAQQEGAVMYPVKQGGGAMSKVEQGDGMTSDIKQGDRVTSENKQGGNV